LSSEEVRETAKKAESERRAKEAAKRQMERRTRPPEVVMADRPDRPLLKTYQNRLTLNPITHVTRMHYETECKDAAAIRTHGKAETCAQSIRRQPPNFDKDHPDWRLIKDADLAKMAPDKGISALLYLQRANRAFSAGAALVTQYSPIALHRYLYPMSRRVAALDLFGSYKLSTSLPDGLFDIGAIGSRVNYETYIEVKQISSDDLAPATRYTTDELHQLVANEMPNLLKKFTLKTKDDENLEINIDVLKIIQNSFLAEYIDPVDREQSVGKIEGPGKAYTFVNTPFYKLDGQKIVTNPRYIKQPQMITRHLKAGRKLLNKAVTYLIQFSQIALEKPDAIANLYRNIPTGQQEIIKKIIILATKFAVRDINTFLLNYWTDIDTPRDSVVKTAYTTICYYVECLIRYHRVMMRETKATRRVAVQQSLAV
jgi:hypothetical protein